jgi:hypothetical protein
MATVRTLKASEIGSFLYCQRAWWYQGQGIASDNQVELAAGSNLHHQHGRRSLFVGLLRSLAWLALLAAVLVLTIYLARLLIG